MGYKAVIFDLDGTILDTLSDLQTSVNFALEKYGYPSRTREEVRSFIGSGAKVLFERALPGEAEEKILDCVAVFKTHYRENVNVYTCPYPGVMEMMAKLKAADIKIGVCSNKFDAAVRLLCGAHFEGMVDACVGESERVPKKPSPVGCNMVLEEMNASASQTLYVGDSDVDVETAVQAGLDGAFVTWGFRDREDLLRAGAEKLFDSADALTEYILTK